MKYIVAFMLLCIIGIGCEQKVLSGTDLQNKLMETMTDYLHKTKPSAAFTVKDVAFYPDAEKKMYRCEFHVVMHYGSKDTIGVMATQITNDFNTVTRTQ